MKMKRGASDYEKASGRECYIFYCPGCKRDHMYLTKGKDNDPVWSFNGNLDKPTFTPSLLYNRGKLNPEVAICHLYLTDGNLQFLSDCTHELAGKTVPLPEMPE